MYGTRDAAQNWEDCYMGFLDEMVFRRGKRSPCVDDRGFALTPPCMVWWGHGFGVDVGGLGAVFD